MTDGRISVLALGALGAEAPSFRVRTRVPSAELARYGVAMRHLPLFSVSDDRHFHAAGPEGAPRCALAPAAEARGGGCALAARPKQVRC